MGSDDEYGGDIPSEDLVAALLASERQHHTSNPQPPLQNQQQPIQQPTPQRVPRGGGSSIIVSNKQVRPPSPPNILPTPDKKKQKGNPILSHIKNVPWSYHSSGTDIVADYILGKTTCALFLSLKYHKLHPDYIYARVRALGDAYVLRVLLVLVDIADHQDVLRTLSRLCVTAHMCLFLAWSAPEAGRYLEAFKAFEHTPPTAIQEKVADDYGSRMVDFFTQVRSVNKSDAVSLVSSFGSVRAAVDANSEEVLMISGWGQQKVSRLEKALRDPFRVKKRLNPGLSNTQRKRVENRDQSSSDARLGSIGGSRASMPEATTAGIDASEAKAPAAQNTTILQHTPSIRPQNELEVVEADTGTGQAILDALAKIREQKIK
jgi:DNA excision repair protein ERCC-1